MQSAWKQLQHVKGVSVARGRIFFFQVLLTRISSADEFSLSLTFGFSSVWVGKTGGMYWKCLPSIMYDVLMTFLSKVIFRVVRQAVSLWVLFYVYGLWNIICSNRVLSGEAGVLSLSCECFLDFTPTIHSLHESLMAHAGNCLASAWRNWRGKKKRVYN